MALKAILDSLEGVSDEIKSHYEEKDGKFYLKVTAVGGWALEDVTGLRNTVATTRKEREEAKEALKQWEALGVSADEAESLIERGKRLDTMDPEKDAPKLARELFDSWKEGELKKIQVAHKKEIEKMEGTNRTLSEQLEEEIIDARVLQAIVKAGGRPKGLTHLVKSQVRITQGSNGRLVAEVIDPSTKAPRPGSGGNSMSLDELVAELKEDPELMGNFDGQVKPGGGTPPGSGPGGAALPGGKKKRSEMTPAEKAAFIREHGREAFHNLPI